MDWLIRILRDNPILVFVLLAWIAGMVGNVAKMARKGREREAQRRALGGAPPPDVRPVRPSDDDVAAEMRRILGMEPESPRPARPAAPPPLPRAEPRRLVEVERPPTPVLPTTQQRRLEIHVDPHVGERIEKRSALTRREPPSSLGSLGGRVAAARSLRTTSARYPLSNLRQALVLNEILGPPLALRPQDPARLS